MLNTMRDTREQPGFPERVLQPAGGLVEGCSPQVSGSKDGCGQPPSKPGPDSGGTEETTDTPGHAIGEAGARHRA